MRHTDWQSRFWSHIELQRILPFEFGSCDCILFGASTADAISVDGNYVSRARNAFSWASRQEADRLLSASNLRTMIETVLGPMQPWVRLGMGDLLLCAHDGLGGSHMLCVHDGTSPIGKAPRGLVALPWSAAFGGWRID